MMIESLSSPVITCLLAVGKVKWYQIIVGGLLIMNLPISYVALKMGASPEITIEIAIVISFVSLLIRLFMLHSYVSFPVKEFLFKVIGRASVVVVLSYTISLALFDVLPIVGFVKLISTIIFSWVISGSAILIIGMTQPERLMVKNAANKMLNKIGFKK